MLNLLKSLGIIPQITNDYDNNFKMLTFDQKLNKLESDVLVGACCLAPYISYVPLIHIKILQISSTTCASK